jgi:hypothetical protein
MQNQKKDQETELSLSQMASAEKIKTFKVAGVKSVLVVLSSKGMVYDLDAFRHQIIQAYPDCVVFFRNTRGKPLGPTSPDKTDLVLDFTGPGERQCLTYPMSIRKSTRIAVGRNAGLFRKRLYDRIFDEKSKSNTVPGETLERERFVQKEVMKLAGVAIAPTGETPPDLGKTVPLELPPMQKL